MDISGNDGVSYGCLCGRSFSQSGAFAYHKRNCKQSKKRLSGALEKAQELWRTKKRRRIEATEMRCTNSFPSDETTAGAVPVTGGATTEVDNATTEVCNSCIHCICC